LIIPPNSVIDSVRDGVTRDGKVSAGKRKCEVLSDDDSSRSKYPYVASSSTAFVNGLERWDLLSNRRGLKNADPSSSSHRKCVPMDRVLKRVPMDRVLKRVPMDRVLKCVPKNEDLLLINHPLLPANASTSLRPIVIDGSNVAMW